MRETKIGILGAGKLGLVIARLAKDAGYNVLIAGSGEPTKIQLSVRVIVPGAVPLPSEEVIAQSSLVILALPLGKYRSLEAPLFDQKLVIDAMNYWWEVDGDMPELQAAFSSSEMVQNFLEGSRVVKALSHLGYHDLLDDAGPRAGVKRKAIAIAGDQDQDTVRVARFVDSIGFDPVVIGKLSAGKKLEPGHHLFGASISADELRMIAKN